MELFSIIMPNLSQTIRKFNRFELKYLVSIKKAEEFKQALGAYLTPDEHSDSCGSYALSSLYYDGPDYRFYWEKMDGIKFRRKLRIRHYETANPLTKETPVFVEIKQRMNRVTQKRRIQLPYREALQLCNKQQDPHTIPFAYAPQDAPVIEEIVAMLWQYNLRPASVVRYARQALVGSDYDIGLRVTFDRELTYYSRPANPYDLQLQDRDTPQPMFSPEWTIIEIKVNERVPYWLTDLVAKHDLKLMRVSKYCRSIELAQNLQKPYWRFGLT